MEVVDRLRAAAAVIAEEFGVDAVELAQPLLLKTRALANVAGPSARDEAVLAYHRAITIVDHSGLTWEPEILTNELLGLARLLKVRPSDLPEAQELLDRLGVLLASE